MTFEKVVNLYKEVRPAVKRQLEDTSDVTREQHRAIQTRLEERCGDLKEQFKVSMPKNEGEDSPSRVMDDDFTRAKLKLGMQRVDLEPEDGEATYDSAMNEIQRQVTELVSLIELQHQG
jgi:hypothetical protein